MILSSTDLAIIAGFLLLSCVISIFAGRTAGKNSAEYFLSGRNMPWWLLGASMVATTFSTDTPNLVTNIVRRNGVAGNWEWWALLLSGMITVFVYARLWRRSRLMTDIEFYELRYSGKPAAFLRSFRASYMIFVMGVLSQAGISLAAIKVAGVMLGIQNPWIVVVIGGGGTALYSMIGGLKGVLWSDFFQFGVAMVGAVGAAWVAVNHPMVGGLHGLLTHANVVAKAQLLPDFSDLDVAIPIFILPLTVFWWSMWYGGAEPGGAAYVVQRILSAKDERHAMGATLMFQVCHYALRPWPWILVALASLVVYPDVASLHRQFPYVPAGDDLGYPAMLSFLPSGLRGITVASLAAAYMSTLSTQFNLTSSYFVNDLYARFFRPEATEKEKVRVGRISILVVVVISSFVALRLQSSFQVFRLVLQIGAGTGAVFLLRWFWWRINAWSEISALGAALLAAVYFNVSHDHLGPIALPHWGVLLLTVAFTSAAWIVVTFATAPTDEATLRKFVRHVRPGGPGWARFAAEGGAGSGTWQVPLGLLSAALGCIGVYCVLFATGSWLYGNTAMAVGLLALGLLAGWPLARWWRRLHVAPDGSGEPAGADGDTPADGRS